MSNSKINSFRFPDLLTLAEAYVQDVVKHPIAATTSVLIGVGTYELFSKYYNLPSAKEFSNVIEPLRQFALPTFASFIAYARLKNIFVKKPKPFSKSNSKTQRTLDKLLEHPQTIAAVASSAIFCKEIVPAFLNAKNLNFSPEVTNNLVEMAKCSVGIGVMRYFYFDGAISTIAAFAHSSTKGLVSAVFNPSQAKYYKKLEQMLKEKPHRVGQISIGNYHFNKGELDKMLFHYAKALKTDPHPILEQGVLSELVLLNKTPLVYLRKLERTFSNTLQLISFYQLNNNYAAVEKELINLDASIAGFEDKEEVKIIKYMVLKIIGKKEEAQETIDSITTKLIEGNRFKPNLIGESKNEVFELEGHEMVKDSFIFKRQDKIKTIEEVILTRAASALKRHDNIIPEVVAVNSDETVLLLSREDGVSLHSLSNHSDYMFYYELVAKQASHVHKNFKCSNNNLDIVAYVASRLGESEDKLSQYQSFIENSTPLIISSKGAIYVFNKDCHPENNLITSDNRVVLLDWEPKGNVPRGYDFSNLLLYSKSFTKDEAEHIMFEYHKMFGEIDKQSFQEFKLECLNLAIPKAISLSMAWSSSNRTDIPKSDVLKRGQTMIKHIESEFSEFHTIYSKEYHNYYKLLESLKSI